MSLSTLKTHFATETGAACGREARSRCITANVWVVSCLKCQQTPEFTQAQDAALAASKAAFDAQEPRSYSEPWMSTGNIACPDCGGEQFRYKGRSCHGHYDDYVCAHCGTTTSRLTETGMSF